MGLFSSRGFSWLTDWIVVHGVRYTLVHHNHQGMPVTARDNIQPSDTSEWGRVKNATKSVTDYDAHAAQSHHVVLAPLGTPENPSSAIFTLANAITFGRFILTISFLYLFTHHADRYLALALYATAAVTDFVDGWVARSTQTVSWLGKIMDPIMDRLLLFTGVLALFVRGEVPTWVAAFVLGRDALLMIGSLMLQRYRRRPIDVSLIGKVTTALLMTGFSLCLLNLPQIAGLGLVDVSWLPVLNDQAGALGLLFVYAGCLCSAVTAVLYYIEGLTIAHDLRQAVAS